MKYVRHIHVDWVGVVDEETNTCTSGACVFELTPTRADQLKVYEPTDGEKVTLLKRLHDTAMYQDVERFKKFVCNDIAGEGGEMI